MNRSQFTFYESYYRTACRLRSKHDRVLFIEAVCAYSLNGTEPDPGLPISVLSLFSEIRGEMDAEIRQSIEGRHCTEYKEWRKTVFERDNYTCQMCGKRGVKINAHHKNAYAYYPDLRYDIDNGITLCVPCHKAIHRRRFDGD